MGAACGTPKDIWIVIYEKGIENAQRVQKKALKLTVEGKLSGASSNANGNGQSQPSQHHHPHHHHHHQPAFSPNPSNSGSGSHVGGSAGLPWGPTSMSTTSSEKFTAISTFVESEWSERDRGDLRKHASKLWHQYHTSEQSHLHFDELLDLTRDSLTTLQRHISVFINNSYEEMKKHTQMCMINLLQRLRLASMSAQNNSMMGSANSSGLNNSGSSLVNPTIVVQDIDWLNEHVEKEKKNLMQNLNAQIEEWLLHYVDIAEALRAKMDPNHTGLILQKQFVDSFGIAIYEVVGPHFFSQHLMQPVQEELEEESEE